MDKLALTKIGVAAGAAGVAASSAQYLAGTHVDWVAVVVNVLTVLLAYLQKSPTKE